ncbi:hypothetical protein B0H14DRAFT_3501172 [Mycena olivaceomarginata]|nr:hypothetical protein B0H14DRAFT_3501172 [Mycena olivaceomarginata]
MEDPSRTSELVRHSCRWFAGAMRRRAVHSTLGDLTAGQPVATAFETDEGGQYYVVPKQPPPAPPIGGSSSSRPPPPSLTGGGTSSGSRSGAQGRGSWPIASSLHQSSAQPAAPVLPTSRYGPPPVGPICAPPRSQSLSVPPIVTLDDGTNVSGRRAGSPSPRFSRPRSLVIGSSGPCSFVVHGASCSRSLVFGGPSCPPSLVFGGTSCSRPRSPVAGGASCSRPRSLSVAPPALPSVAPSPASSSVPQVPPDVVQMLGRLSAAQMQAMLMSLMTQASGAGAAPQ